MAVGVDERDLRQDAHSDHLLLLSLGSGAQHFALPTLDALYRKYNLFSKLLE
jgi:hypothetical protein